MESIKNKIASSALKRKADKLLQNKQKVLKALTNNRMVNLLCIAHNIAPKLSRAQRELFKKQVHFWWMNERLTDCIFSHQDCELRINENLNISFHNSGMSISKGSYPMINVANPGEVVKYLYKITFQKKKVA